MAKKDVKTEEAMMDHVRMMLERGRGGAAAGGSPEEQQAQELFYDAMDTGNMDLIYEALDLDPGNVDCLLQLLFAFEDDDAAAVDFLRTVVKIAEGKLGEEFFEECKGHFWGMLETRPYMRARAQLAQRLVFTGQLDEAVTEHEGLLELCPNDNLGIRYPLLGLYLRERRLDDAARLLETYKEERPYSAQMGWAYVLERILAGAVGEAEEALQAARKQNGYVEAYLKGHRKMPKEMPGYFSPGSREEAVIAAEFLKPAWDAFPDALEWLRQMKK